MRRAGKGWSASRCAVCARSPSNEHEGTGARTYPSAMIGAMLAEDKDDYESAPPRAHASPVHRTSRAALAEYKDKPCSRTTCSTVSPAICSSTLEDVANLDLELDELLHAPRGHSFSSRPLFSHGVDAQDLQCTSQRFVSDGEHSDGVEPTAPVPTSPLTACPY